MSTSEPVRSTFLDADGPIALAHRGGVDTGPTAGLENTWAAFERAVGLGATHLETDVHASRDGTVFAFHDDDLARLTGVRGAIADHRAETVRSARVAGSEPVPELRALLDAFPSAQFNIDVKHDDAVEPTARVIETAAAQERVCIAGFSHRRLQRVRDRLPGVATSCSPTEVAALRLGATRGVRAVAARSAVCAQVSPRWGRVPLVDRRFVRHAHELGLAVHVWTVDDRDEMVRLLDLGVDGIVTDRLDVLLPLLGECAAGGTA